MPTSGHTHISHTITWTALSKFASGSLLQRRESTKMRRVRDNLNKKSSCAVVTVLTVIQAFTPRMRSRACHCQSNANTTNAQHPGERFTYPAPKDTPNRLVRGHTFLKPAILLTLAPAHHARRALRLRKRAWILVAAACGNWHAQDASAALPTQADVIRLYTLPLHVNEGNTAWQKTVCIPARVLLGATDAGSADVGSFLLL